MKRGLTQLMFAGALLAAAGTALADTVRIEDGQFRGTTGGGEFQATIINGSSTGLSGVFQTFCLEHNEPINTGPGSSGNANVYDYTVSTQATLGGGGPNPDPISFATAYLYTQFRNGTLSNYAFGGTAEERQTSADALQVAIWTLEEEFADPPTDPQAAAWVNEALAAVANASIWGQTLGDVRVMTLTQNGNNFQDMLTLIPLPPSAWMGLASLAGVGVMQVRRRMRTMTTYA